MLRKLPAPITGTVTAALLLLNIIVWLLPVYAMIIFKLLTWGRVRRVISLWLANMAQVWAEINVWIWDTMLAIEWDIRGVRDLRDLRRDGQYLVLSNHQSWNDIAVLMKVFGRRAPFFRFFIKQELIWVPLLGLVWWGLDYPFMKRHTREQIAKNPNLKTKDIEATRRACEQYRGTPVMILNFLEGTRFTARKREQQKLPYQHLLKPRAGGASFVLATIGDELTGALDVTIVYPDGSRGFWGLISGQVRRVIVDVRDVDVPSDLIERDAADEATKAATQAWVSDLWIDKDARIATLLGESEAAATQQAP